MLIAIVFGMELAVRSGRTAEASGSGSANLMAIVPYVERCGDKCTVPSDLQDEYGKVQQLAADVKGAECPSALPALKDHIREIVADTMAAERSVHCKEERKIQCEPKDHKVRNRLIGAVTTLVIGILAISGCSYMYDNRKGFAYRQNKDLDDNCSFMPRCKYRPSVPNENGFEYENWFDSETGRIDYAAQSHFFPTVDAKGNSVPPNCDMHNNGLRGDSADAIAACKKDQDAKDAAYLEAHRYVGGIVAGILVIIGVAGYGGCLCLLDDSS